MTRPTNARLAEIASLLIEEIHNIEGVSIEGSDDELQAFIDLVVAEY